MRNKARRVHDTLTAERQPVDGWLLFCALAILCIGWVMVTSASSEISSERFDGNAFYYSMRHGIFIVIGLVAAICTLRVPMSAWQQRSFAMLMLGFVLLVVVLVVGREINGAKRWIPLPLVGGVQASEIAKLCLMIWLAGYLDRRLDKVRASVVNGLILPCVPLLLMIVLLALVLGRGPIAAVIPHAALAGILMKVGWEIIDWGYLKHFRCAPRDKLLVMFVTLVLTVLVDLITAIAVGLILAGFVTARWMEAEELKGVTQVALPGDDTGLSAEELTEIHKANGDVGLLSLRGRFSYASARELAQAVPHASPRYKVMIYDFTYTAHVDTSAAISIAELISEAGGDESRCFVIGLSDKTEETLRSLGALDDLPEDRVIRNRLDAIRRAVALARD